ncbi:hypothetical protein MASR2M29_04800 [Spirochaetota bacterium]
MKTEETFFGTDWPYSKAKTTLLKSAALVIKSQGPRSATLKNIAGKARVTEPAVFRHFEGVDGLFKSLHFVTELYLGFFASCIEKAGGTGLDRIEAAFAGIADGLAKSNDYSYIIAYPDPVFRQYSELMAKTEKMQAAFQKAIRAVTEEAAAAGQLAPKADAEWVSEALFSVFSQSLALWARDAKGYNPAVNLPQAIGGLCAYARKSGLKPKPAAKPELVFPVIKQEDPAKEKPAPKAAAKTKAVKTAATKAAVPKAAKTAAAKPNKAAQKDIKAKAESKPIAKPAKVVVKPAAKAAPKNAVAAKKDTKPKAAVKVKPGKK